MSLIFNLSLSVVSIINYLQIGCSVVSLVCRCQLSVFLIYKSLNLTTLAVGRTTSPLGSKNLQNTVPPFLPMVSNQSA